MHLWNLIHDYISQEYHDATKAVILVQDIQLLWQYDVRYRHGYVPGNTTALR